MSGCMHMNPKNTCASCAREKPHEFYSTRKGVPLGEIADLKHCNACGGTMDAPQHQNAPRDDAQLLRAIDGTGEFAERRRA